MTFLLTAMLAVTGVGDTVLLDFQADWCGPCKSMDPLVAQLAAQGYPVRTINIDERPDLKQQYGISSIPCFVVLVNGKETSRWVGMTNYGQLVQHVNNAGLRPAGAGVDEVRAQSPDRPRRLISLPHFGRNRDKTPEPTVTPPLVDLGQPVSAPDPTPDNFATAANSPAAATAAPFRPFPPPVADSRSGGSNFESQANPLRGLEQRLLASSVRLRVDEADGYSFGSGTIIDFRPAADGRGGFALVLTCGHVFRDSTGNDGVHVDLFDGGTPTTLPGRIVSYDLDRDIGLVSFATNRPVTPLPLAPADAKVLRSDKVISVGCDHGKDPTVHRSHVTAINSFVGPPNLQVAGQPAVGRSGGGLFDEHGNLIGVCNFADPTDRAGLYAAVELAHGMIDKLGFQLATASRTPASKSAPMAATSAAAGLAELRVQPSSFPGRDRAGLQAAQASGQTEVICIVRQGGHQEVLVINDASPELLSRLSSERHSQQGTFPTSLEARRPVQPSPPAPERDVIYTTTDWQPRWR